MNKSLTTILLCSVLSSITANAVTIALTVNGGTSQQQAILQQAATFWESNLIGYADGIDRTVDITTTLSSIDGVGGTLGSAGFTSASFMGEFALTSAGQAQFDTDDLVSLVANGTFLNVAVHEFGHILGFGTLFTFNNLYENGTGEYTGAAGLAAYQAEFDASASFIPIELDGGPGTENAHFNESSNDSSDTNPGDNVAAPTVLSGVNAGESLNNEILTGFLSPNSFLSDTTLGVFQDLGFTTVDTAIAIPTQTTIPEPSSLILTFTGLGALMLRRRRS